MKIARTWKAAVAVAAVLLVSAGGAYAWIVFTRPPELALAGPIARSPAPSPAPNDPLAQACRGPALPPTTSSAIAGGLWVIQPGSLAGYRAHEKFAQVPSPHVAVARTERVGGWLLIGGSDASPQLETGCVAVELAALRSVDVLPGFNTADRDETARNFLRAREHPYAIFQPYPSPVDPNIARGGTLRVELAGALEVGGISRPATFSLSVRYTNGQVAAAGSTTVDVADYDIDVPQTAGDFVAVNPKITLEVSLVLLKS
jgi:YceI-like protein